MGDYSTHDHSISILASALYIPFFLLRTRTAFEAKLQKSSRATDFRVPQSICTMFNVMVDAKAQSAKLCAMDLGQEVDNTQCVLETHFL